MPGVASTSGRLHCELLRLLFLQAHRETEKYCRVFGVPAQTNQDFFRYKRAAFYSGMKGKVGLIFAKAAALRININTDGRPLLTKKRGELPASFARPTYSLPLVPPTFTSQ